MTLEQKQLDKVSQVVTDVINRLAQDDPTWGRFLTKSPAYRYYHHRGNKDQYFWTTDAVQHNGKLRFASGIYRYIKTQKAWKLTKQHYHAKRKDAKVRAYQLWEITQL